MINIPEITRLKERHKELEDKMSQANFYSDVKFAGEITKEHQRLDNVISKYEQIEKFLREKEVNESLLDDQAIDDDFKELIEEDIAQTSIKVAKLEKELVYLMIPTDPSDSRNTVVEIRAGTGGEEASLFAGDLYRMYTKFAESKKWRIEVMSTSASDTGGLKEVIFLISGEDVYKFLKFESGVHRVQRVPTTEACGRIHTSAATVAVLPEAEEVDVNIAPEDLEISICRASGPGGQGVNTTDSAVQILHKPTGITVNCADERSQQKNKIKAMKVLRSRLLQKKEEEEREKYAKTRRDQIGSGDRSERIRTYNFPQNRLTDHRIGLTLYSLPSIMEGDMDELIEALQKADFDAKLKELA